MIFGRRYQAMIPPRLADRQTYRPEIDGLRAIAVLAVICFHAQFTLFDRHLLRGGYLGVDVFFVISGYLIGRFIFCNLRSGSFSLGEFYKRRAQRILPALFVVVFASFVLALVLLPPKPLIGFSESLMACVLFIANIFFWWRTDYFAEPGELLPLLHLWSLSVEEQFYLIFPFVLMLLWSFARRSITLAIILMAIISLVFAIYVNGTSPSAAFYLFPFRAWELLAGAVLSNLEEGYRRRVPSSLASVGPILGMILILSSFAFLGTRSALGIGSILAVTGTALVILGEKSPAFWVLTRRPLIYIGLISYSLYLWHQPFFAFSRNYAINSPSQATFLLLTFISIAMAHLSWRYVEQPFRSAKLSNGSFVVVATTSSFLLFAAALGSIISKGLPFRYSLEQQALLELSPKRGAISIDGRPCTRRSVADACIIGAPGVVPTFALLGDSHAETLSKPLDELLKRKSSSAYVYTNAGCPFIANVVDRATANYCNRFTDEVFAALVMNNISSVIVNDRSTAYMLGTRFDNKEGGVEPGAPLPVEPVEFSGGDEDRIEAVAKEWRNTMKRLMDAGKTIFYILPVPEVGWNVPRTIVKVTAQGRLPLTTSLSVYLERNKLVLGLARELKSSRSFVPIYPHHVFCSVASARCSTHEAGEIFYTDTDHLSIQGAQKLVDAINREIDTRE
jgi:peptidoglycan/LPS O-acetylase OafA/YrhL